MRLMFQFDEAVEATTRVPGRSSSSPSTSLVAIAVERLNVNAPEYISAARRDPDGSAIRLALTHKIKVNTITAAERLYVDLLPETWKGPMPGLPQEVIDELVRRARDAERQLHQQKAADKNKKPLLVRVKVASQPTFIRYVFAMPGTVNVVPERADGRLTLNFDQQVNWDMADAKATLPPTLKSIEAEIDLDSVAVVFTLNGTPEVRAFREDRNIVVESASMAPSQSRPRRAGRPNKRRPQTARPRYRHRKRCSQKSITPSPKSAPPAKVDGAIPPPAAAPCSTAIAGTCDPERCRAFAGRPPLRLPCNSKLRLPSLRLPFLRHSLRRQRTKAPLRRPMLRHNLLRSPLQPRRHLGWRRQLLP